LSRRSLIRAGVGTSFSFNSVRMTLAALVRERCRSCGVLATAATQ
jgi:hypothetical protein